MSYLKTRQTNYATLRKLSATDDVALVWSTGSQTVDRHEDCGLAKTVDVLQDANACHIIMHGTDAANETMAWMLIGWARGGPAEEIAYGTATLGTQRVATGTATELYADTITITGQYWPSLITVSDSGNNRIAKISFDMNGIANIACVMQKTTAASCGAKIRFF
jgi:hypothetical protein